MSLWDLAKQRYKDHKNHAKRRGIEFDFSLEDWCQWWEDSLGPDWLFKRGNKIGMYCMARKKDEGAYNKENVKCMLHGKNVSEGFKNRRG